MRGVSQVATASRSASAIRRLRSRAGSRIMDGLLASSGKVAGVGLVTAILTLGFTGAFG